MPRLMDWEAGLTESEKSGGRLVTVTFAVPLMLPLAAVTVKGPPAAVAVNSISLRSVSWADARLLPRHLVVSEMCVDGKQQTIAFRPNQLYR